MAAIGPADHLVAARVDPLARRFAALSAEVEERISALTVERDAAIEILAEATAERDDLRLRNTMLRENAVEVGGLVRERDAARLALGDALADMDRLREQAADHIGPFGAAQIAAMQVALFEVFDADPCHIQWEVMARAGLRAAVDALPNAREEMIAAHARELLSIYDANGWNEAWDDAGAEDRESALCESERLLIAAGVIQREDPA